MDKNESQTIPLTEGCSTPKSDQQTNKKNKKNK